MIRCPARNRDNRCPPPKRLPRTNVLRAIVRDYLDRVGQPEARFLQYYACAPTFVAAVIRSAMAELPGDKRFAHQWRIPAGALRKSARALLRANLQTAS